MTAGPGTAPPPHREIQWVVCAALGVGVALMQRWLTWRGIVVRQVFPDYLSGDSHVIFNARLLMRVILRFLWDNTGANVYTLNLMLQCAFAAAGMLAVWAAARRFCPGWTPLAGCVVTAGWLCWGFSKATDAVSYPYDLPAFAFSALGLAAILHGRYIALLLCVGIGCLNKETVFWLPAAWLLYGWAMARPTRRLLMETTALAVVYTVAYVLPRVILPQTEGSPALTVSLIETDPGSPLPGYPRILQNLRYLVLLQPPIGLPWIHVAVLPHLLAFALWRWLPVPLRAVHAGLLFFYLPTMVVGNVWELRIFNEAIPLMALVVTFAIRVLVQRNRSYDEGGVAA